MARTTHREVDRTRKVAALLQREMAGIIARELNDARINTLRVTGADISRDLKQATIYVSGLQVESADEVETLLNNAAGYLRKIVGAQLNLRSTPGLLFKYDHSIERGARMSQLIDALNKPHAEK